MISKLDTSTGERQPARVAPPRVGAPNRRVAATNNVLGSRPAGVRLAATPARLQHHQLTRETMRNYPYSTIGRIMAANADFRAAI